MGGKNNEFLLTLWYASKTLHPPILPSFSKFADNSMKLHFWSIGKAHEEYVKEGIAMFSKRIANYYSVEWKIIPPPKNAAALPPEDLKKAEGDSVLSTLHPADHLVLLDEKGKYFTSEQLATFIQVKADASIKNLVFLIGGAYGVSDTVKKRAGTMWSLSPLVFPHQLVRVILAEQVYRACTIQRNEKYHHS